MKRFGFTLSEVLISLSIIGIISVITIPILIKNTRTGAEMVTLKSILSNLEEIIRPELIKTGGKTLNGTLMLEKPNDFLAKLNTIESSSSGFASSYQSYTGKKATLTKTFAGKAILSNHAVIGLKRKSIKVNGRTEYEILVYIDVNGTKKPNIVGLDLFSVKISGVNDYAKSKHVGDLTFPREVDNEDESVNVTESTEQCRNGKIDYCYEAVFLSNFDPEYLDKY